MARKVIPFANGTESMNWLTNNCDTCKTKSGCFAKKQIEIGEVLGGVSIKACQYIGIKKQHSDIYVSLNQFCSWKNKRTPVKKIKTQLNHPKIF